MLEEGAERLVFLHRPGELGEVLEPAGALGRAVGLEHRGVARFVEHEPGELGVGQLVEPGAPAGEIADQIAERAARLGGQLVGVEDRRGGQGERHALGAGELRGASPPPCRRGRAWGC